MEQLGFDLIGFEKKESKSTGKGKKTVKSEVSACFSYMSRTKNELDRYKYLMEH